jgi:virginiamycin B lyase
MMTAMRLGNGLKRLSLGAMATTGLLALAISASHPAMAGQAALTGTVSSTEEGKMEGVVVSAKRPGSTIMVSVSTNAKGEYSFPEGRLAAGDYDITMRAVGYTLPATKATIDESGTTHLDLKLAKASQELLALQLTNSEWVQSAPGTPEQKIAFLRCLDCHGLQRPIFSKENASEMARTVERMGAHAANASPNFPFFHEDASEVLSRPPNKGQIELASYIASINLSSGNTWSYKLKTQPRPAGTSTQAIVTT